ncbi:MAG: hypothetical protein WA052_00970 [Microgenomates group bacterium]
MTTFAKNIKVFVKTQWFVFFLLVFAALRLINLKSGYIWFDDTATIGGINKIPWPNLFGEVLNHTTNAVTGPFLPTLLSRIIVNLFGPDILLLRLPDFIISILSIILFKKYVLSKIFSSQSIQFLVLIAICFSIPFILYSQSIQPSIYYFFSSIVQFGIFLSLWREIRSLDSLGKLNKKVLLFGLISTPLFLVNYMSVIVFFILLGTLLMYFLHQVLKNKLALKKLISFSLYALLGSIPYLALTYWRLGGDETYIRQYFEGSYYVNGLTDIFKLIYDTVSYLFNFAYTLNLYRPLGYNLLSAPFLLLVILGLIDLIYKNRKLWLIFVYILMIFAALSIFKIIPLGGVRHILIFAPFIFVFFGMGLHKLGLIVISKFKGQKFINTTLAVILITYILTIFMTSGKYVYLHRQSAVDLNKIVKFANQYSVKSILDLESYDQLSIIDYSNGKILKKNGLSIYPLDKKSCPDIMESYLLVAYHYPLDPKWNFPLPDNCLTKFNIGTLEENLGNLDQSTIAQSIYYPQNGFFIYIIQSISNL